MSKIFAEVPFHKISGFYYTQNIQLFGMKKQKELHHIRPGEMKKILGGATNYECCRPHGWPTNDIFHFKLFKTARKT